MEFVTLFADHQVERIRRGIINYRTKTGIRDTLIAKRVAAYLPANVTHGSVEKNIQRLRKGERIRGAAFLNACVQFLEVEMATPPEEELGLALKNFIGLPFAPAGLWPNLEGDFLVREADDKSPAARQPRQTPLAVVAGAPGAAQRLPELPLIVLTISKGEGLDYGVARERHFIKPGDDDDTLAEMNALDRKGVCLPIGGQDLLIMMRDFLFSHMYILKRDAAGFSGRMIMPTVAGFFDVGALPAAQQSHFDVALHRMPSTK